MFFETGSTGSAGMAVVTFGTGTATTRTFKIKATYYQCSSTSRCTPYNDTIFESFTCFFHVKGPLHAVCNTSRAPLAR